MNIYQWNITELQSSRTAWVWLNETRDHSLTAELLCTINSGGSEGGGEGGKCRKSPLQIRSTSRDGGLQCYGKM